MTRAQQRSALALAAGVLFGVGLGVSGMAQPRKVLGFLDVAGDWDRICHSMQGPLVLCATKLAKQPRKQVKRQNQ
jgi:uncharacterized membrane protein YedE/YeeE